MLQKFHTAWNALYIARIVPLPIAITAATFLAMILLISWDIGSTPV